jgi:hypothetical protein
MGTRTFQIAGGGYFTKEEKCGKDIGVKEKDEGQYDQAMKIDYVYEAALVVRTSVFERIGLIDPLWQFGWEGPDLCKRASRFSIESWYVPEAKVEHEHGGTLNRKNQRIQTNINFRHALKVTRNRFRFLLKHYPLHEALITEFKYDFRSLRDMPVEPWAPFLNIYSLLWNLFHLSRTLALKDLKRENYEDIYTRLLNYCNVFDLQEKIVPSQRTIISHQPKVDMESDQPKT